MLLGQAVEIGRLAQSLAEHVPEEHSHEKGTDESEGGEAKIAITRLPAGLRPCDVARHGRSPARGRPL
jgi:hypothetical protein